VSHKTKFEEEMIEEILMALLEAERYDTQAEKAAFFYKYLAERGHLRGAPLPIYEQGRLAEQLQYGEIEGMPV